MEKIQIIIVIFLIVSFILIGISTIRALYSDIYNKRHKNKKSSNVKRGK